MIDDLILKATQFLIDRVVPVTEAQNTDETILRLQLIDTVNIWTHKLST